MDVQFWIYILIGVIYFLGKILKKPDQPTQESEEKTPGRRRNGEMATPETDRPKQLTFEDLLREITAGKQPEKAELPPVPQPKYVSYEDDLEDEARSLEEVTQDEISYDKRYDAKAFKAYEDAKSQVFQRSSLEETMHVTDTVMEFGKFKVFEAENKRNITADYIRIFQNPEELKQAVVMSEILKRKF